MKIDDKRAIFRRRTFLGGTAGTWAVILTIALVTGLAMWLVPDDTSEAEKAVQENRPKIRSLEPIGDEPEFTGGAMMEQEGVYARSVISQLITSGDNAGQSAFEEAQQQQREGRLTDAYLLYFYAARQGHGEAALELGTQADPAYFSVETSSLTAPDQDQAFKWYKTAAKAGVSEAERRLLELRNRVELHAANGDQEAQRLMLQWK